MKIERPDWKSTLKEHVMTYGVVLLNKWFDENVEPINKMLEEGVEVFGFQDDDDGGCWKTWTCRMNSDTHSMFIINRKELKKETAEEVLNALWNHEDIRIPIDMYQRVKKFLDKK